MEYVRKKIFYKYGNIDDIDDRVRMTTTYDLTTLISIVYIYKHTLDKNVVPNIVCTVK